MTRVQVRGLSRPNSDKGRLQRACLALINEHERDGALPTSIRFLFYELVGLGAVAKSKPRARQEVSEALMVLRELERVPWEWLVDETRTLTRWRSGATVADYLTGSLDVARIDCWAGAPAPMIVCESRSLAGVLTALAGEYLCPIGATNGQSGGFLVTDLAPELAGNDRRVLYLGDFDWSGTQIEAATRRTLARHAGRTVDWERLALTAEQVDHYGLPVILKEDRRYTDGHPHEAVETEALRQTVIVDLVRARLDELLPEPLEDVLVREAAQRVEQAERLRGL